MSKQDMLRQISLSTAFDPETLYRDNIDENEYTLELHQFRESLLKLSTSWPEKQTVASSPLPVVIPDQLLEHLNTLGDILCRAITSIVERWWSDELTRFHERMPILPHQEAVLRVMFPREPLVVSF